MENQTVTKRQAILVIAVFILGSTIIMGGSYEAEQDAWVSMIAAALFAVPLFVIYGRIAKLFPGRDLYSILDFCLGKVAGRVVAVLFVWYSLHLGALVIRNFSEFIKIVMMPETPQIPIMLTIVLAVIYLAKQGSEVLGKWSLISFAIVISFIILTILLSVKELDYRYLMPFFEHCTADIASSSYQLLTFPFAEAVVFLSVADSINKKDSPVKIYLWALLIAGATLLTVILRNIQLLGKLTGAEYYPSYIAARLISVGDFLNRIEGTVAMNFVLAGIIKITVCLVSAAKGLAYVFHLPDYVMLTTPVGFCSAAMAVILFDSTMEMYTFIKTYRIYAIPFQILLPVLLWIVAEVKAKKQMKLQPEAE